MEWHGDEYLAQVHAAFGAGIQEAAAFLVDEIRKSISVSSHGLDVVRTTTGHASIVRYGANRSQPGQPPHMDTGALLASIQQIASIEELVSQIGSLVDYALYLELGTRFMAARPFLLRSLTDNAVAIVQIATKNEYRA